jgi:hypothetical protein
MLSIEHTKFVKDQEDNGQRGSESDEEDPLEFETLKECTILVRLCDQGGLNYYLSKEDNAELIIPRIYLLFN